MPIECGQQHFMIFVPPEIRRIQKITSLHRIMAIQHDFQLAVVGYGNSMSHPQMNGANARRLDFAVRNGAIAGIRPIWKSKRLRADMLR